jgi:hypothetical protein
MVENGYFPLQKVCHFFMENTGAPGDSNSTVSSDAHKKSWFIASWMLAQEYKALTFKQIGCGRVKHILID